MFPGPFFIVFCLGLGWRVDHNMCATFRVHDPGIPGDSGFKGSPVLSAVA
jgi:hypothetical protein